MRGFALLATTTLFCEARGTSSGSGTCDGYSAAGGSEDYWYVRTLLPRAAPSMCSSRLALARGWQAHAHLSPPSHAGVPRRTAQAARQRRATASAARLSNACGATRAAGQMAVPAPTGFSLLRAAPRSRTAPFTGTARRALLTATACGAPRPAPARPCPRRTRSTAEASSSSLLVQRASSTVGTSRARSSGIGGSVTDRSSRRC